jgi:hypothetical protein
MFKKPTVFVIGAGASAEFGMPLGGALKTAIRGRVRFGADEPAAALRNQMIKWLGEIKAQQLFGLGPKLANVIPSFISMDEALHFMSNDADVVHLGKIAVFPHWTRLGAAPHPDARGQYFSRTALCDCASRHL